MPPNTESEPTSDVERVDELETAVALARAGGASQWNDKVSSWAELDVSKGWMRPVDLSNKELAESIVEKLRKSSLAKWQTTVGPEVWKAPQHSMWTLSDLFAGLVPDVVMSFYV